jgi:hypothetical protein
MRYMMIAFLLTPPQHLETEQAQRSRPAHGYNICGAGRMLDDVLSSMKALNIVISIAA